MILLPLRPASLTYKNPQRRTKVYGMRHVGRKDRSFDLKMFLHMFCGISCSCDFCGCCLTKHVSFSLRCALQKNIFYLSGHIKAKAFSIHDLLFFELGLNSCGLGLMILELTERCPFSEGII